MPDLRDDLGRLADFVGEPGPFRELEEARRRRERRRRASALVVSLSVLVVLAVVAAAALRPRSDAQNSLSSPSAPDAALPAASTTIWPENAINGTSVDEVQAALDAGDDTLRWRTDLEEVVQRFGRNILGRNMRILGVFDGDDGMIVRAFPCPPGEQPGAVSCDVMQGELVFELVQPAGQGGDGIWSVRSVTSEPLGPLAIGIDPGSAGSLPEGSEISFDVAKRGPATSAHLGIVVSDGCNIRSATKDVLGDGTYTLQVPELRGSDPACAATPAGYAFLYITDDTTLPSTDPINEPTAIEFPWLTVVPFSISPAAGTSESAPPPASEGASAPPSDSAASAAPTELEVVCDDDLTLVAGSGTVAAQADGVHLSVVNKGTLDTQFNIADGAKNVDLPSGEEKQLVQPLDPGQHFVLCGVEGGTFTQAIDVVDPDGYWFDPDPDCSADQSNAADLDASAIATDGDPNDELQAWAASLFGSDMGPGVSALEGDYTVRPGAYPEQTSERAIVAVDAGGHVIGVVWFQGSGSSWTPGGYLTCDANAVF